MYVCLSLNVSLNVSNVDVFSMGHRHVECGCIEGLLLVCRELMWEHIVFSVCILSMGVWSISVWEY